MTTREAIKAREARIRAARAVISSPPPQPKPQPEPGPEDDEPEDDEE